MCDRHAHVSLKAVAKLEFVCHSLLHHRTVVSENKTEKFFPNVSEILKYDSYFPKKGTLISSQAETNLIIGACEINHLPTPKTNASLGTPASYWCVSKRELVLYIKSADRSKSDGAHPRKLWEIDNVKCRHELAKPAGCPVATHIKQS